jgi:hypothetical protein
VFDHFFGLSFLMRGFFTVTFFIRGLGGGLALATSGSVP